MPAEATTMGDPVVPGSRREAALRALADVPQEPGSKKPDPIVIVDDMVRRFGGLTAVDVGHVEIQRGAITALIGPNGAGKSTFFNQLTGFDQPDSGEWSLNGKSLKGAKPYQVARRGHGAHLPAHQGAVQAHRDPEHAAGGHRAEGREHAGAACSPRSGGARRTPTPTGPTSCWRGSSSTPSARTSPAACPAGSASCWRWPAR